jgi:hypothetical protein
MSLGIRNEEGAVPSEKLAARKRINRIDTVNLAQENELRRFDKAPRLR